MIYVLGIAVTLGALLIMNLIVRRAWPIVALVIWVGFILAEASHVSPYSTANFAPRGIHVAAIGVSIFAIFWAMARRGSQRREVTWKATTTPFQYHTLMGVLAILGLVGLGLAYRKTGLPIFQHDIDAVRAAADPPFVVGLLREATTVASWITVASFFGLLEVKNQNAEDRATARHAHAIWFLFFLLMAVAGGSRNTVIFAVAPAVLGLMRRRSSKPSGRRRAITLIALGLAVFASILVSGQRILHGTGVLEDTTRAQAHGSLIAAGISVTMTNLAAPIETLGRVDRFVAQTQAYGHGKYSTYSLSTIYRHYTTRKLAYDITGPLSFPYYQNVGTMLASPLLDGGRPFAYFFAGAFGFILGRIELVAARRNSLSASLLCGYAIYCGLFSVYECLPIIYGAYYAIVPMAVLSRVWLERTPGAQSFNVTVRG